MSKHKKPCIFGCHRLSTGKSDMCSTCRNGLRYWDNKDHADIVKREEHLEVLSARIHRLAANRPRKGKQMAARERGAVTRAEARA